MAEGALDTRALSAGHITRMSKVARYARVSRSIPVLLTAPTGPSAPDCPARNVRGSERHWGQDVGSQRCSHNTCSLVVHMQLCWFRVHAGRRASA